MADLSQVPALKDLARECFAPYVAEMGIMPAPGLETFDQHIAQEQVWVSGAPPIAYLIAYPKGLGFLIDTVAIAPNLRGRGFGKELIQFAETLAQNGNHDRVWLYANEVMRDNIALYQYLGYEIFDRREEDGYTRVYLHKFF